MEMTEASKKISTSKMEDKACLLDDELGKGFLSSWKAMSMPDDDIMDFNFEAPSKNKKAFNFEKLDMDFENNFDKISSFKVDMSDLDLSSPAENTGRAKGPDTCAHKDKEDHFSFSFDFKELDEFNFGSNITKGENRSSDGKPSSGVSAGASECGGSKSSHHDTLALASDDRMDIDIIPSENEGIFENETSNGDTPIDQIKKMNFTETTTSVRSEQQQEGPSYPKRTEIEIVADKHHFSEKDSVFTALYSKNDFPGKVLLQNTDSLLGADFCQNSRKSDHSDRDQISSITSITGMQSDPDNGNPILPCSVLLNSAELQNDNNRNDAIICRNSRVAGNENGPENIQNKMEQEGTSVLDVLKSDSHEMKATNATYDPKSDLIFSPMNSEKFMARKEGAASAGSELFERHKESLHQLQKTLPPTLKPQRTNTFEKMFQTSTIKIRTHATALCSPGPSKLTKSGPERHKVPAVLVSSMDALRTSILSNSKGIKSSSGCASKKTLAPTSNILMGRGEGGSNTKPNLAKTVVSFPEVVKEANRTHSTMAEADTSCDEKKITMAAMQDEKIDVLPTLNPKKSALRTPTLFQVGEKEEKGIYPPKRSVTFGDEGEIKTVALENNIVKASRDDQEDDSKSRYLGEIPIEQGGTIMEVPIDDGHVEKAEAYSKELEALSAVLRKKQEEAKEVLARALVTSSELLLLNHPMHHHKFDMVQRFADQVMTKQVERESGHSHHTTVDTAT